MALNTSTQAEIALKHLLGKSQTASSATKGPNNEAESISLINNSTNIWISEVNSNPSTAISEGVAEYVVANLTLDNTSSGQAFFATYPTGHPKQGERVVNAIPPSYGFQYEAKPYAGGTLIPPGDSRDWLYQYQSGIFYQQTANASPTPTTIQLYVYKGQTLFDEINKQDLLLGGLMSSGVIEFSGITKTSNTTFSISPVKGWIVDNTTNVLSPNILYITYSGATNVDSPYRTTNTFTYILLDSGGTISYQPTSPTPIQRRQNIYLGKIGHPDKVNYSIVFQIADYDLSPLSQLRDMFTPIPLINDGVYVYPNSGLTIFNSSGTLYGLGINFVNNKLSPNVLPISGNTPTSFQYRTQTGGTLTTTTIIDPTKWDNNGVITTIGSPAKQSTNQRIFLLQDGSFRIQFGQTVYGDLETAISSVSQENFVTFPNFKENGILIGVLSISSDATNITNINEAKITLTSKFGETTGLGAGGSTTTLQKTYDNSNEPEIITNDTLKAVRLKIGSSFNSDNLIEFQNNLNEINAYVNGNGLGSFKNIITTVLTGTTISGGTINAGTINAGTISATTYFGLPARVIAVSGTSLYSISPSTNNVPTGNGIYFGSNAGNSASGSTSSIFLGQNAGNGAINSYNSNFIGSNAGNDAINSYNSNFLGNGAGRNVIDGYGSIFMGINAGSGTTSSYTSVFIGRQAGLGANNSFQSNFIGQSAGVSASNSSNSNFFGFNAGNGASNSSNSVFIGRQAGQNSTNSSLSNFIGNLAGNNSTNITSSNFIGNNAGRLTENTSYSNLFGFNVGSFFTGNNIGNNNIIIGTNISLPNETSNSMNLGGVLFGSGLYSATTGNPSIVSNNGRIGVNVVNPTQALHVSGNLRLTGGFLDSNNSFGTTGQVLSSTVTGTTWITPTDTNTFVTGGTYNNSTGTATFRNNTGGTFNVTGFTDTFVTGGTFTDGTITFRNNTGGTFNVFDLAKPLYWYDENDTPPGTPPTASGSGSIAFGNSAQALGSDMFVYGNNAGYGATSADASIFMGNQAGFEAINANQSTFIGDASGYNASGANSSVFIGQEVGFGATNASESTFIGAGSGQNAVEANNSVFIGRNSGANAENAYESNFIGKRAGDEATNANNSNFIGESAGAGATNAEDSNFLGSGAGSSATNAFHSNFLGRSAGSSATNASNSNFLGNFAGVFASNANNSNFIGTNAGDEATNANNSNFIGEQAGYHATNANRSNFFGNNAGVNATDAHHSFFVGQDVGTYAANAHNSNFLGQNAGQDATNANNSNFIGTNAGYQATGTATFSEGDLITEDNNGATAEYVNDTTVKWISGDWVSATLVSDNYGEIVADSDGTCTGYITVTITYSDDDTLQPGEELVSDNGATGIYISDTEIIPLDGEWAVSTNVTGQISNITAEISTDAYITITFTNIKYEQFNSNFIGQNAGYGATSASYSNFLGPSAGYEATNAKDSNFFGNEAGYHATNANRSNFFGQQAGQSATNAFYSNFLGQNAGSNATNAYQSNFFGDSAGNSATDANDSNFLGSNAGRSASNASYSNFFGNGAGQNATNAYSSNFLGNLAGINAEEANYSNFFGDGAGVGATNAHNSNFLGQNAGRNATDTNYSNFFGYYAGSDATNASYSNLFGYQAGKSFYGNNIGANNIIIGTNISLPDATDNAMNLGGVLFGAGFYSDFDGDPSISEQTSGRIGINIVNPDHTLHIKGDTNPLRIEGLVSGSTDTDFLTTDVNGVIHYRNDVVTDNIELNGLSIGNSQTFTTGTTGTDFNIVSSGNTHTFNIPDASATNRGLITTGSQTIAGNKTFSNNMAITSTNLTIGNPAGGGPGSISFRRDSGGGIIGSIGGQNHGLATYALFQCYSKIVIGGNAITPAAKFAILNDVNQGAMSLGGNFSVPPSGATIFGRTVIGLTNDGDGISQLLVQSTNSTGNTVNFRNTNNQSLYVIPNNGQHILSGPFTSTTNNQIAWDYSGVITQRVTTGDTINGFSFRPTITNTAANQVRNVFNITPTFTGNTGTNNILNVGTNNVANLFSVNDIVTGVTFTVNDISGLPILNATSDSRIRMYELNNVIFDKNGINVILGNNTLANSTVTSQSDFIIDKNVGSPFLTTQRTITSTTGVTVTLHTIAVAASRTVLVEAFITGYSNNVNRDSIGGKISGVYKRSAAGSLTIVGGITSDIVSDNDNANVTFTISSNNILIRVNGDSGSNYIFTGTINTQTL